MPGLQRTSNDPFVGNNAKLRAGHARPLLKRPTKNAMLFYKKHSINRSFGEEKSFALMFNFLRCYNGFFAIFPPFRG